MPGVIVKMRDAGKLSSGQIQTLLEATREVRFAGEGHAEVYDGFYKKHFTRYLNFHRPSGPRERKVDAKGKVRFVYKRFRTLGEVMHEIEKALPEAQAYFEGGTERCDVGSSGGVAERRLGERGASSQAEAV